MMCKAKAGKPKNAPIVKYVIEKDIINNKNKLSGLGSKCNQNLVTFSYSVPGLNVLPLC